MSSIVGRIALLCLALGVLRLILSVVVVLTIGWVILVAINRPREVAAIVLASLAIGLAQTHPVATTALSAFFLAYVWIERATSNAPARNNGGQTEVGPSRLMRLPGHPAEGEDT